MLLDLIVRKQNGFQTKNGVMANTVLLGKLAEKAVMEELEPFNHIGVNNPDPETLDGGRYSGMVIRILNKEDDSVSVGRFA